MYMLKTPKGAGDTLFMETAGFLDSLPDEELKYLESLKASSDEMAHACHMVHESGHHTAVLV